MIVAIIIGLKVYFREVFKIHVLLGALIDGGEEVGVYEGGGEMNINLFYKKGTFQSCLKQI